MITRSYGFWLGRTFAGTTLEEAQALLAFDRAVDPGRCAPNPAMGLRRCNAGAGWPAIPTRIGLQCGWGLMISPLPSRIDRPKPAGPAERKRWVKRRQLERRAARRLQENNGHRCGPW
jgi:hypothetical protein